MLAALALPATASGQLVGGPLVPSGHLRLDVDAHYVAWDERFGLRHEGGSRIEEIEPLGWNLGSGALGTDRVSSAALAEARLRTLFEDPGYRFDLGNATHLLSAHVRRVPLGFRLGVFRWLTVGASLPMVQRKIDSDLIYASGAANAGLAPSSSASEPFLTEYRAALAEARAAVDLECGTDGDTPECRADRTFLERGDTLLVSLATLFGESAFFPLESSEAGATLAARMEKMRSGLAEMGASAFTTPLPFGVPMDQTDFDSLVVAPTYGRAGLPLKGTDPLWEPGDLEVSAAVRLLNLTSRRADSASAPDDSVASPGPGGGGFGIRLGVAGTLRLPTGTPQDTIREFLDMEIAEGQMDVEVRVFGGFDWARRVGLAFDARYGIASPANVRRRVRAPDAGFAPRPPLETVRWRPGDYLEYSVSPQLLVTPELAIGFVYRSFSRGADAFEGEAAKLAALSLETEAEVRSVGVDAKYSSFLAGGFPLEVRFGWETAFGGAGGRTPKTGRVRFGASLFRRIWGGG